MDWARVGDFTLAWGESLVWDDRSARLYFVDCLSSTIHWLENGSDELRTLAAPSLPTGLVPTDDGRVVVVLDDGLYVVDVDTGDFELVSAYPDGLGGRANDACADLAGNLITGKLNLGPAEGSAWWFSSAGGWRLLDADISNTNGPQAFTVDGRDTLVVGDTGAQYFAYDYDAASGTVGPRRVFGDVTALDGSPDGSTVDADGGLWCALVGGAQLARFTDAGLDRTIPVPMSNPTDVTFGGPDLDRLYVVSIDGPEADAGALLRLDGVAVGRAEPRARIS